MTCFWFGCDSPGNLYDMPDKTERVLCEIHEPIVRSRIKKRMALASKKCEDIIEIGDGPVVAVCILEPHGEEEMHTDGHASWRHKAEEQPSDSSVVE